MYEKTMPEVEIKWREVEESDLQEIRSMILPQFNPMRVKLLTAVALHWGVQVFLVSISALIFALSRGEASLFPVIYIFNIVATLFVAAIIFWLRIKSHNKDLWDWEICKELFSEGFWVAETVRNGKIEIVGSFALGKTKSTKSVEDENCGSIIELTRLAVSPSMDFTDVGRKLLSSVIVKASARGYDGIVYCVPESSADAMKLCRALGFKASCTRGDFIKVHIMTKLL